MDNLVQIFQTDNARTLTYIIIAFVLGILLAFTIIRDYYHQYADKVLRERQDQFTGLASHYLLTPISIIQMAVNNLIDSDSKMKAEERMKMYYMALRGQQRLFIIAEQLLLLGDIDQNRMEIKSEIIDISTVVGQAVSKVDVFAREKNIDLKYIDGTDDLTQIRADKRRLIQAFIAIIDNAIKFSTDSTPVEVNLTYENQYFVITIADHGIGMPDKIMHNLSDKYYRGGALYKFDYEGLGLGLHIAKAIIAAHEGIVQVDSKPKQGTVVVISLPLR